VVDSKTTGRKIERAAVLGSGVMGAAIAAHLANVGISALLLDLKSDGPDPNSRARAGLQAATRAKPAAFFAARCAALVEVGNFDDDLARLADCDWIVEAVIENLDIKKSLYERIAPHVADHAILSSNTSGLSAEALSDALPERLRPRFLVTHFFNPPRYLKLLELVRGPETADDVVEFMAEFGERVLGKGPVHAKDTPNFIANRIGVFGVFHAMWLMVEKGYTVAEIDKLTGKAVGRAKSATFRTVDLVGLDTLAHVARNLYDRLPLDSHRELFVPPPFMLGLIDSGALGAKAGAGFYRKATKDGERVILMFDWVNGQYVEQGKVNIPSLGMARGMEDLTERLKTLVFAKDRAGEFLWENLSATLRYAASCIPEIADDVVNVDRAMRWGFGWELGPFEVWDALGVRKTCERMVAEGHTLPPVVTRMLDAGRESFYERERGQTSYFDAATSGVAPVPQNRDFVVLEDLKDAGKTILESPDATLIDLGDEVACLEFHTKMNTIGPGVIEMIQKSIDEVEARWRGVVVGNDAQNFCAGANLLLILSELDDDNYDDVEWMVERFQNATSRLRFATRPVVVAPRGLTLGGGCEIVLGGDAVVAAAETYIGLVELGAGVIPAGGGCKELIRRIDESLPEGADIDLFPHVQRVFETVGMARVATSAVEAQDHGFLRSTDGVVVSGDLLLHEAKRRVMSLDIAGYHAPRPRTDIRVVGEPGLAAIRAGLHNMALGGFITAYEKVLGDKLAWVLCGGEVSASSRVSEGYLLELEREAFMSLCGNEETLARMEHILKTGKALRN